MTGLVTAQVTGLCLGPGKQQIAEMLRSGLDPSDDERSGIVQ